MTDAETLFAWLFVALAAGIGPGCSSSSDGRTMDEVLTVEHDGLSRIIRLHIPEVVHDGPLPLLIAFHGAGSSGLQFQQGSGLDELSDRYGFAVAYPSATATNWAEGCDCVRPDLDGVDDVGFAAAIPGFVSAKMPVDVNRVFAAGYSQGAVFLHHLACEKTDVFAGFAAVAGQMSVPVSESCAAASPASVLLMHGSNDSVLPFDGIPTGSQALLSVPSTALFWARNAGCDLDPSRQSGVGGLDIRRYESCEASTRVELIEILDGTHTWPRGTPDAPETIVDFFGLR